MIARVAWHLIRSYLLTLPAAVIFTTRHWPELVVLRSMHGMATMDWVTGLYGLMDAVDMALFAATALVALAITFRDRLQTNRVAGWGGVV